MVKLHAVFPIIISAAELRIPPSKQVFQFVMPETLHLEHPLQRLLQRA